jgi:hypothetical protein
MQRNPWSTITLGSLLLIAAWSKGVQHVESPQPENSKPPVKTEQRGRIVGIGGVFFKSANRDQAREWYSKHLGLADKGQGVMLPWREHDDHQPALNFLGGAALQRCGSGLQQQGRL